MPRGYDRGPIHWAARNGRAEVVRWLVRGARVPVDQTTSDATTPLHLALARGHAATAAALVDELGADARAVNAHGCNAAHFAAGAPGGAAVALCAWLRARGVDLALANANAHSPLAKAAQAGRRDVCEWLLEPAARGGGGLARAHAAARDADGNDAAALARAEGHVALADWLGALREAAACHSGSPEFQ